MTTSDRVIRHWHTDADAQRFRELGVWVDATLADQFDAHAERTPDRLAVSDGERRWTYGELRALTLKLAALLLDLGVATGEPVAAQLPSSGLVPLVHLACNRIGAIFVPLSTSWRASEVGGILRQCRPPVLIVPASGAFDFAAMARELIADLGAPIELLTCGPGGDLEARMEAAGSPPADVLAARHPSADDPAHAMVSSGTTGLPKVSVWSSNNLYTMLVAQYADRIQLTEADLTAGLAPANTGSTGYVFPVLAALLVGASVQMLQDWDPDAGLALLASGATVATAIPTQIIQLLQRDLGARDLSRLTRFNNAGAPLPPAAAEELERRAGVRVQTVYGATDGGVPVMTSVDDPDDERRTSVGRLAAGQEMRLVDPVGNDVPAGEPGEVIWRGATKSYGYLNQPDYDEAAFPDGWFHSGDVGQFDERGYLRIVGRAKDMILRGGNNIFPAEVEGLMIQHPAVAEAAIVGMPDPVLGERACAFVVLRAGAPAPTLAEMSEFLLGRGIAKWKLPERLEVAAALDRNAGGKLDKESLRQTAARLAEPG